MNYWAKKELNKLNAKEHVEFCLTNFSKEIESSVSRTEILDEKDCAKLLEANNCAIPNNGIVSTLLQTDVISAITSKNCKTKKKVAVLNFASYKNPGGMFINGSYAQEEAICHESTLYPVLLRFADVYYEENKNNLNKGLYTNKLLYSPDILIFDKNKKCAKTVDVITMAAPNRGVAKKHLVPDEIINDIMAQRIRCVLEISKIHDVETLILGAFGCGVFKNDTNEVASIFYNECAKYDMNFVFAIPDNDNFKKFVSIFNALLFDN